MIADTLSYKPWALASLSVSNMRAIQISGYAYDFPGKTGEVVSDLVLGDLFEAESEDKGFLKIRIPDGRSGYVRKEPTALVVKRNAVVGAQSRNCWGQDFALEC